MKEITLGVGIVILLMLGIVADSLNKNIQQSKEHHERFHNLIIDSVKTHSIIDRMNYDIGCDLKSVTINCDKFVD